MAAESIIQQAFKFRRLREWNVGGRILEEISLGPAVLFRWLWLLAAWLIAARYVFTTVAWSSERDFPILLAITIFMIALSIFRSDFSLFVTLIVIPILSQLHFAMGFSNASCPFLPLMTLALVLVPKMVIRARGRLERPPWIIWLANCFGLAVIIKAVVGLLSPSPANALWLAILAPTDDFMAEFQGLNAVLFLVGLVMVFEFTWFICRTDRIKSTIRLAYLVQLSLVILFALAQLFGWPATTRESVHAPFYGIHELGGYTAVFFGICLPLLFAYKQFSKPTYGWLVVATLAVFVLLLLGLSKSAWLAASLILALFMCLKVGWKWVVLTLGICGVVLVLIQPIVSSRNPTSEAESRILSFLNLQGYKDKNNQERLWLYEKAWILASERPLDGVGLGDFRSIDTPETEVVMSQFTPQQRHLHGTHNIYLTLLAEGGWLLLLLFASLMLGVLLSAWFHLSLGAAWSSSVVFGVLASLIVNSFNDLLFWPCQSLILGQAAALIWITPTQIAGS